MAKSQFEINYENALAAKDQAATELANANKAVSDQEKAISQAENDLANYGAYDCQGTTLYYDPNSGQLQGIQTALQTISCSQIYNMVWKNSAAHQTGVALANKVTSEKSKLAQLKAAAVQAKAAYDSATALAASAYQDWLEWKKSNMTPEELEQFLEVEQKASAGALRMDAWKWAGIIIGVLALGFGVWWLFKKFKSVKVA